MSLVEIVDISYPELDSDRLWGRSIDLPRPGSRVDAHALDVAGWVLGRAAPAVAVELVYGGVVRRRVPARDRRADVATTFPHLPDAEACGFLATVNAIGTNPELELHVRAVLRDQARVPLGIIRARPCWRDEDGQAEGALVSVVIPCYNHARFLGEAIESALAQTYPHIEVVVVDDGSADNTEEVAARYPGVRCVRQKNRGLAGARNTGIRRSNGDYLVFLDADDRLAPRALEEGLEAFTRQPQAAFVFGRFRFTTTNGSLSSESAPPAIDDYYLSLLHRNFIAMHATVMYRREVFETVGTFDPSLKASEDYDLYFRIARQYPIAHHDQVVAEYRQHGSNMTRDAGLMLGMTLRVLYRQTGYAMRNTRYRQAYAGGLRFWTSYYGGPLLRELSGELRAREWRRALRDLWILLQCYPGGVASIVRGTISRADTTRPR